MSSYLQPVLLAVSVGWPIFKGIKGKLGKVRGKLGHEFWQACAIVVSAAVMRAWLTQITAIPPETFMEQGAAPHFFAGNTTLFVDTASKLEPRGGESLAKYAPAMGTAALRCVYCDGQDSVYAVLMMVVPPHILVFSSYLMQIYAAATVCRAANSLKRWFILFAMVKLAFEVVLPYFGKPVFSMIGLVFRKRALHIGELVFAWNIVFWLWLETRYLEPNRATSAKALAQLRRSLDGQNQLHVAAKEIFDEVTGSEDLLLLQRGWNRADKIRRPVDPATAGPAGPIQLVKTANEPTAYKLFYPI